MNPELAKRLRRYGDTVDQAAEAAGAPAGPLRDVTSPVAPVPLSELGESDQLEPVVSIIGWRHRYGRRVAAAAAALIVVAAGALLTARITGSPEPGTAASTDVPGLVPDSADETSTSAPKSTGTTSTSAPAVAPVPTAEMSAAVTSTSSSTTVPTTTRQTDPPVCPDYTFNDQFPLRLCNRGPAVEVIQQRLGVPVDGFFGPATETAVEAFQRSRGLDDDGLVGFNTWAQLVPDAVGPDTNGDGITGPDEMT